jgi:hypothetical protein
LKSKHIILKQEGAEVPSLFSRFLLCSEAESAKKHQFTVRRQPDAGGQPVSRKPGTVQKDPESLNSLPQNSEVPSMPTLINQP